MNKRLAIAALVLGTAIFALAIALRHEVNPWLGNGIGGLLVLLLSGVALRSSLRDLMRARASGAASAVLIGVALVAATHLGFYLTTEMFPALGERVSALYADINDTSPGLALTIPLIVVVVFAEEMLWRGIALRLGQLRLSLAAAGALSVVLYALPQLLAQAWVLALAALIVGSVFTIQRIKSERLVEPLISHAIWSISIFALFPLL